MKNSLINEIHSIDAHQLMGISAFLQAGLLVAMIIAILRMKKTLFTILVSTDLIINTLLCLPFFGVSSYSPSEVNKILSISAGFPIQTTNPSDVNAVFLDTKGNEWQNVNIYAGRVSSQYSYRGPLELSQAMPGMKNTSLVFAPFDSLASVVVIKQRPTHVRAKVISTTNCIITLSQNHYPGWFVKVNGRKEPMVASYTPINGAKTYYPPPGITVVVPAGESTVDFIYERKELKYFVVILHLAVLSWLIWKLFSSVKNINRSSSLSSRY